MRALRIYVYEIITSLALSAVAYMYIAGHNDSQMVDVMTDTQLIALYVLIAVTTEALIAASLRPKMLRVFSLNVLVAAVVVAAGLPAHHSLTIAAVFAIVTVLLRVLVAAISVRASQTAVRRITAGLIGVPLVGQTLYSLYATGETVYREYYFFPRVKEGYIMPNRWQDFVGHAIFLAIAILVLYLSYRLLKYAFRHRPLSSEPDTGSVAV